ncbi:hypothetical protein L0F63_006636 [Massospora cicadina]|nr:hypothetical protein L0F63_006636 [Massospora cicadina]
MVRLGQHSNSTLNAEQHAFKQLDDLPSNLPSVGAAGDTLFNSPILQHFSSDINPSEDHVSPEISSPEISLGLPNEETLMSRQSTGHSVSTAPNSPHEVAVVTRPALHRRVRSEACKNDYFFQTASSGELPQINTNWDWFEKRFDKLEAASITPPKKDRGTAPILAQKSLRVHETVPDGAQHSLTKLDLADDPNSKYTVKFPVDPRTKFPWRNQSILNRRRAVVSKQHPYRRPRPRYHPEVLARKYSFPPKTAEQKPKASASPRPPPSQPLKSALVKHKRAHTYGGSGKVRFAMDFDLEFTPSLHPDADQKVDTDHGLFIPSDKILTYARAPPFPNQVRVLCPEVEPPLPTSLLLSNTTSESSCTASSFMFSAEEDSLNSPELAQSVLSDDSGLFEASLASPGPFDPTRTSGFSSKSSSPLKKTVYKDQNPQSVGGLQPAISGPLERIFQVAQQSCPRFSKTLIDTPLLSIYAYSAYRWMGRYRG